MCGAFRWTGGLLRVDDDEDGGVLGLEGGFGRGDGGGGLVVGTFWVGVE